MNIIDKIVSANYVVTIDLVEELGRQHTIAINKVESAGSTYLAILIAGLQNDIIASDGQQEFIDKLDSLNKTHYAAVLKGIAATGARGEEVSRLGTFARTAKSTLMSYIKAGGGVRELIPGMTSKGRLRDFVEADKDQESEVRRSAAGLIRKIHKIASADIDEARRELQWAIDQLIKELNELEDVEEPEMVNHNLDREYRHNA